MTISLFTIPLAAPAEDAETALAARHFEIRRAAGPIKIDGVLDEPAWAEALAFELPYEWSPGDNVTPPVETEFLATYDDDHLYAAWRAHDPNPAEIRETGDAVRRHLRTRAPPAPTSPTTQHSSGKPAENREPGHGARRGLRSRGRRRSTAAEPGDQQMRGSCSPTSMSTMRSLPTRVLAVTMPG